MTPHTIRIDPLSSINSIFLSQHAQQRLQTYASQIDPVKTTKRAASIFTNDNITDSLRSCIAVAAFDMIHDATQEPLSKWLSRGALNSYNIMSNNHADKTAAIKLLITREMGMVTSAEKIIIAASIATAVLTSVITDARHTEDIIFTPGAVILLQDMEADEVPGIYAKLRTLIDSGPSSLFYPAIVHLPTALNGHITEVYQPHVVVIFKNMIDNLSAVEKQQVVQIFSDWVNNNVPPDKASSLTKAVSVVLQLFYESLIAEVLARP